MKRRMAMFSVSNDLFKDVFQMPKGTSVLRVSDANSFMRPDSFDVVVAHPILLEVPAGCEVPTINPILRRKRKFVLFKWTWDVTWDWGIG